MNLKPYPLYKKTDTLWLASIPDSWKMLKTKYLFIERSQKGFPSETMLAATQSHGVVPKTMYENRTVIAQKDLHLLKLVEPGDFVISLRSFQGGIEKAHYRGIISPAYTILIPTKIVTGEYFKYLAKSKPFIKLLTTCVTGIREGQNIDYEVLKRNKLPVPPLPEQFQIARYIDWKTSQINRFIKAKKRQIELLKEQKQVIINDAVTGKIDVRTGTPYPKYKDSRAEWLGLVPEHWKAIKLKSLSSKIGDGIHTTPSYVDKSEIYFINGNNLSDGKVVVSAQTKCVEINDYEKLRIDLKKGTILISINGTIGNIAFYNSEKVILGKSAAFIELKDESINEFIYFYLQSTPVKRYFGESFNGTTINNLSLFTLRNTIIEVPSENEVKAVTEHIKNRNALIDVLMEKVFWEIQYLLEYRVRLISDVVTGKADVRNIKIPEYDNENGLVGIEDEFEEDVEEATVDNDL